MCIFISIISEFSFLILLQFSFLSYILLFIRFNNYEFKKKKEVSNLSEFRVYDIAKRTRQTLASIIRVETVG